MVTYIQTAYNQLESPSGAIGEPPDGPGSFKHIADQIDGRLGIGGAEYCSGPNGIAAIPSSRLFKGKLAYRADVDIVFRYVGSGNTAVGSSDSSSWQAWGKPPAAFTPAWSTGLTGTAVATQRGLWGISAGMLWVSAYTQYSSAPTNVNTTEVTLTLPSAAIAFLGEGGGSYLQGGASTANSIVDLSCWATGTPGSSSTSLRIRQRYANAAGSSVKQNAGFGVTGAANDIIVINFRGPSATNS